MRNLEIRIYPYPDLDANALIAPPPAGEWIRAAEQRLPGLFALTEGFLATVVVRPGFLTGKTSKKLSLAELSMDLEALVAADPAGEGSWIARVLIATSSDQGLSVYGAMFDAGSQTNPGPCRRGCAAFVKAIEDYLVPANQPATTRESLFVRTIGHEVCHTLNLCHDDSAVASLMSEGRPDDQDLLSMELGPEARRHLAQHEANAVRPGGTIPYGFCPVAADHPSCGAEASVLSGASRPSKVRMELTVHPGTVYWETSIPTLIVGEPLCVTATLYNESERAVSFPWSPTRLSTKLRLGLLDSASLDLLTPPATICEARGDERYRLASGDRIDLPRVVTFARGHVALPRAGSFWVTAALRVGQRFVRAEPVPINVAPPLVERHERYCDLATTERSSLDLELGGSRRLDDSHNPARRLLSSAPDFPLSDHVRLAAGRMAVNRGRAPFPAWREALRRVAGNQRQPAFLRAEAEDLLDQDPRRAVRSQDPKLRKERG